MPDLHAGSVALSPARANMYISKPPIDGGSSKNGDQLAKKPTVKLHRGTGNETTVMVRDDDQVKRHPTTGKFTSKWQNEQSSTFADEDSKAGKKDDGRPSWKKNTV